MRLSIFFDAARCRTAGDFLIRDLPGTSGRLDVLCRVLIATFRSVPTLCPNIQFSSVLGGPPDPPLFLQVKAVVAEDIPESELACGLVLKELLNRATTHTPAQVEEFPQYQITRQGFSEALQEIVGVNGQLFYLVEEGEYIEKMEINLEAPLVFVLGDHQGVPSDHEKFLMQQNAQKISIGERSLLGSQVITLLLLELARRLGSEHSTSEEKTS